MSRGIGAYFSSISSSAIVIPFSTSRRLAFTLPTVRPAIRTSASFTSSDASLKPTSKR